MQRIQRRILSLASNKSVALYLCTVTGQLFSDESKLPELMSPFVYYQTATSVTFYMRNQVQQNECPSVEGCLEGVYFFSKLKWYQSPPSSRPLTFHSASRLWLFIIAPINTFDFQHSWTARCTTTADEVLYNQTLTPKFYQMRAVRLCPGTAAELISSQCVCFHRLRLCYVSTLSQLRWSRALRRRNTKILFLPNDRAQHSNSVQSRSSWTGSQTQIQL